LGARRPEEKPTELPSGPLEERFQALAFEKERFEQRLRELMKQLGDESSRAAALHYRLWVTTEDRKVLEMNLAGEQAASRTWETVVQDLRAEIAELKRRLAKYEPPPEHAA
jgi:chromosome segregation ATPase